MRRALLILVLVLAALFAAGTVSAEEPTPEPEPPPTPVIAAGVTIAGLDVAGLTRAEALRAVKARFARPLELRFMDRRLRAKPAEDLRARAKEEFAVDRAIWARPGTDVRLPVSVNSKALRRYVARLADRFDRAPRNAVLRLSGKLRPHVSKAKPGRRIEKRQLRLSVRTALKEHTRWPIRIRKEVVRPTITRGSIGPTIVIRRESKRLYLYRGVKPKGAMKVKARFGVATGLSRYPTPLGRFTIVTMQRNPWWYPPDSDWAEGAEPVPPGPGNPLGTRWMGLSISGIGIHGTPDAASIGYSASHGCIRMRIPEAEWLFERVRVGSTVFIVGA
jgi:lipoprotein-anchoring transpeptidase ErfK/SrfK